MRNSLKITILSLMFVLTMSYFSLAEAADPVIPSLYFKDAKITNVLNMLIKEWGLKIIYDENALSEASGIRTDIQQIAQGIATTQGNATLQNGNSAQGKANTQGSATAQGNKTVRIEKNPKRISLHATNIHLSKAVNLILSTAGVDYAQVGDIYVVGNNQGLIASNLLKKTTERIKLQYADAFKVKDTLVGLGVINYDNIFVYGELNNNTSLNTQEKDKVQDNTNGQQSSGNASSQSSDSSDGNSADNLTVQKLTERQIRDTDKADSLPANVLVIRDTLPNINQAKEIIKALDQPAPKIMVEAKVIEINENGMKQLGVDWITDDNKQKGVLANTIYTEIRSKTYNRSPLSFNAAIKAQIDQENAKILSSPKISTLEGKAAFIYVGDKVPYVSSRDEDTETNKITTEVSFLNAGVTLEVLPILTENNDIQLKIYSEVSSIKEWKTIDKVDYPVPSMRQAQTITRVKAGDTIVLGGLIVDEDRKGISKLPILGDIPILKYLFSWTSHEKNRNEVVISLTPYIVQ